MVSMKDLSAACGVSVATVSKALNDHKDISEETKKLIREKAKELGYRPNISARALKTNKTNNIGVLFADASMSGLTHDYFANVLDSFRLAAEERGYDITFLNCNKTRNDRLSYYDHACFRGMDGVVIACINFSDPEVAELINGKIPVVTIDHVFANTISVMSNNIQGMIDLVTYIAGEKGHRKVAYIHGDMYSGTSVTTNRISSFLRTMEKYGVKVPSNYLRPAEYRDMRTTAEQTEYLLKLPNRPTCILFPDDFAAIGGINVIKSKGLRIPEDISVAGYDGLNLASQYEPMITTIKQDTMTIGTIAAKRLIDLIERPLLTPIEQITVQGLLEKGKTVGEPCTI